MSEVTKAAGQILFQNSLAEVVRKLRSTSKSESEVIEQCIADIKREITSTVQSVKVTAMVKAAYFSMLGYNAEYSAFNVIEVMADKTFVNKRLGYMAACMTFTPKTDVLPLLTALLKRDLGSTNQYEVGFALYCVASVCTPDLARDLVADIVSLLSHPRNYVRKKAILSLYRVFFEYPNSLRPTYPLLKEKLDSNSERADNDPTVRGAVVAVLCELARRNPENFLGLAVPFFSMLTTVHSNWTLIKIVKVFGYFAPLEPRLGKKLVGPIANLINVSMAKSVQYECILAVANGMSRVASITKLAAEKMKSFIGDSDQNLKYLGLDAMSRMLHDTPKLLSDQRNEILECLDDVDTTIRRKALDILSGLVTKKNIVSTIDAMMERCVRTPPDEDWSNRVIRVVIETAQRDDYALVQDFEWYTSILLHMSLLDLSTFQHGGLIERELVAVMTRVNAVRSFGVVALSELLSNPTLLACDVKRSTQWEVLKAAAFLCGEFPYWLPDKCATCEQLVHERVALLHPEVQVAFIAAAGKIAAYVHDPSARPLSFADGEDQTSLPPDSTTAAALRAILLPPAAESADKEIGDKESGDKESGDKESGGRLRGFGRFSRSAHPDVQECAALARHGAAAGRFFRCAAELSPVAAGAQAAVAPPAGLDLDEPFCAAIPAALESDDSDEERGEEEREKEEEEEGEERGMEAGGWGSKAARRRERMRNQEVSAFYIKDMSVAAREESASREVSSKRAAAAPSPFSPPAPATRKKTQTINRDLLRPANYTAAPPRARQRRNGVNDSGDTEEEDEATKKFRNVDLTHALAEDERLPETIPYAQLLQMRSKAEKSETGNGNEKDEAKQFEPVVVLKVRHMRVTLRVTRCHAQRDGFLLSFTVSVANLASSGSAYGVTLSLETSGAADTTEIPRLVDPNAEETNKDSKTGKSSTHTKRDACNEHDCHADKTEKEKGEEEEEQKGEKEQEEEKVDTEKKDTTEAKNDTLELRISERIKGSASATRDAAVLIPYFAFSASLSDPLPLRLTYVRDKRQTNHALPFPLIYEYFAKSPRAISAEEFNSSVLAQRLSSAPLLSAFVSLDAANIPRAMPRLLSRLRLRAVEIYRDAVSLHGTLRARKSAADEAHVAALLRAEKEKEKGAAGVRIAARAQQQCVAEALIQSIAAQLTRGEDV